jgi:hypothetical protein
LIKSDDASAAEKKDALNVLKSTPTPSEPSDFYKTLYEVTQSKNPVI